MPDSATSQSLFLYSTTVSDVGTVRSNNQDSSFAGSHLIAICDGMGGHAGGDTASSIAIRSLAHIERDDTDTDVQAISSMMETSVVAAHDAIVGKARRERKLAGMGTTVTAVALVNGYWVVAHIGDSRAYLLRDGKLERVTCDHSYVQHLIDTGRLTPAEARNHPQRNVVMRVLGDFDIDSRPDITVRKAHPADRWLLCSDGLCGVLEDDTIAEMMTSLPDQSECAQQLVSASLRAGSTDNVTAVIADATLALDASAFDLPHQTPLIGGAASSNLEAIADIINGPVSSSPMLRRDDSPAQRAADLINGTDSTESSEGDAEGLRVVQPSTVREETGDVEMPDTGEIPIVQKDNGHISADPNDPEVAKAIKNDKAEQKKTTRSKKRRFHVLAAIISLLVVLGLAGASWGAYAWSQTRYYVGEQDGKVAIYQGVPTDLFGLALSHEIETTSIATSDLPQTWQDQLAQGITVSNYEEAATHVELIRDEMEKFQEQQKKNSTKTDSSKSNNSSNTKDSSNSKDSSSTKSDSSKSNSSTDKSNSSTDSSKDSSKSSTKDGDDK